MENKIVADKMSYDVFAKEIMPNLKQLREEDKKLSFNELLDKLMPPVKRYIARRLRRAKRNKTIPSGKYQVEDFVDELYVLAYDYIQEVKEDVCLHSWLFQKADELLEEVFTEEEFDHLYIENIDDYGQQEWDAMEEDFSTDGDGDLVLEEELDDDSYPKHQYTLQDIFIEDTESDLIDKLSEELTQEEIDRHIDMILHRVPRPMRTTFDLLINQRFKLKEIADIKDMTLQEVEKYLSDAQKIIRLSFEKRYLSTK